MSDHGLRRFNDIVGNEWVVDAAGNKGIVTEPDRIKLDPQTTTFGYVRSLLFPSVSWSEGLVRELSAFPELERCINAGLRKPLTIEAFDEAREILSSNLGVTFFDVDCLLIDEAVQKLSSILFPDVPLDGFRNPGVKRNMKPDGKGEDSKSPKTSVDEPRRRGRRKGQDKIGEAITRLASRMKDNLPVDIPSIATDVGCTPENLRQSRKFMDAYKSLTNAFARLPRGRKEDGIVEAEDEGNF